MNKATFLLLIIINMMIFTGCPTAPGGDNAITEFSFKEINPVSVEITGAAIEVTVPYDTIITSLTATFITTGESVSIDGIEQVSGTTVNNYTNPVTYTVTSEDGSTYNYVVIVKYEFGFYNDILSFKFLKKDNLLLEIDVQEEIDDTAIVLNVPYGTDRTSLIADFSTNGAEVKVNNIKQISGHTVNDFSDTVLYTVTAADGSSQVYNIEVMMPVNKTQLETMIADGADVTRIDTSGITDMAGLFYENATFNQDISGWDVSNVTVMYFMFANALVFNQDIGGWDVSNVMRMQCMFDSATSFNQDIGGWDVSSVNDIGFMFHGASLFNQDLSGWDVGNVGNMTATFNGASSFSNKDLSGWNVAKVVMHSSFNDGWGSGNTEPEWS